MSSSTARIPYAQWKALHPEKYGAVSGGGSYTTGRGAYTEGRGKYSMKKFGKDLNKAGKSEVGRMIRKEIKKAAIEAVVSGSGAYTTGRGAYTTGRGEYHTNALVNGDGKLKVAKTNGATLDEHGSIMIEKREFVSEINSTGSSDFSVQTFNVNPALKSVFPWLSQTATNFDEWESIQMIFEYESVISETSVSSVGSLGTVIMAANYNSGSAAFTSFPQMVEYGGAVRGKISDQIVCGIESDPEKLANDACLYTRAGSVPSNQDIKTYDLAKFQLGLFGVPTAYVAGTQIGLLFVRYVVKLSKPKLYDSLGFSIGCDQFEGNTALSATLPFGTSPFKNTFNSIGGSLSKLTTSKYTLPDNYTGTITLVFSLMGTSTGAASILPVAVASGNLVGFNSFVSNGGGDRSSIASSEADTNSVLAASFVVNLPDNPGENFITFSTTGFPGGAVRASLVISEINSQVGSINQNKIAV